MGGPATRNEEESSTPRPARQAAAAGQHPPPEQTPGQRNFLLVGLAVLGVVYGDIGTSPIYALRECFFGLGHVAVTSANVLGILSLIFWALIVVISLKYMAYVLQADNRGEGGIFALIALLRPWHGLERRSRRVLILFGLVGASLLYGGVMITPSISILSAVEGLEVATPAFKHYVIPITIAILFLLFVVQQRGTARVGALFGPVIVIWFGTLAALGVAGILHSPGVLAAVNPVYALRFFSGNGWTGFVTLYAVFLVVTGGEALYADLGHFGRRPIRLTWFFFVLPALLLNYFGQGALLLSDPAGAVHPFYHLAPAWGLYPLVVLATAATVIASQAAITGAFSLTSQAVQLGLCPTVRVLQTSHEAKGQIYVPAVNWVLMAAAIGLVLAFQSSSNLASAYGVAVNSTMAVTTVLAFRVALERGGWRLWQALLFLAGFLAVDLGFLGSNLLTLPYGGWFPIVTGLVFFAVLSTWRRGSELVNEQLTDRAQTLADLIAEIGRSEPLRVPGTGVFLTGRLGEAPPTLKHHLERIGALHEQVIVLTVLTEDVPKVPPEERTEVESLAEGFVRMILHYGFMQGPNIPSELAVCRDRELLSIDLDETTYYIGHQTLVPGGGERGMATWRDRLFAYMARNAVNVTTFYHIPADRVVELGLHLRI